MEFVRSAEARERPLLLLSASCRLPPEVCLLPSAYRLLLFRPRSGRLTMAQRFSAGITIDIDCGARPRWSRENPTCFARQKSQPEGSALGAPFLLFLLMEN